MWWSKEAQGRAGQGRVSGRGPGGVLECVGVWVGGLLARCCLGFAWLGLRAGRRLVREHAGLASDVGGEKW